MDGVTPLHYAILHVEDIGYDAARFINLLLEYSMLSDLMMFCLCSFFTNDCC
jgi:hypothetical protein